MTRRKDKLQRTARAVTTRRLVEQFRLGPMTVADICSFLVYGLSGGGKYARELYTAGLVTCKISGIQRVHTYTLVDDQAKINAHLDNLDAEPPTKRSYKRTALAVAQRQTGRQFHLLADDMFNLHKVASTVVAPDPLALPRSFFALAAREALDDGLLERKPMTAPPRPGFPDPAHYRLDLSPEVRS